MVYLLSVDISQVVTSLDLSVGFLFLLDPKARASSMVSGSEDPRVSGSMKRARIPPIRAEPPITNRGRGFQVEARKAT